MSAVKRRYDNARRQVQAAATRRDVIDAAGELFAAQGYAATSVDAVAAHAGVSRETIFKTFGSKRQLLQRWVEREVAGGDGPVPIAQQHWVEVIRTTSDGDRQIELAAAALRGIYDRAIDALVALRAAAHVDRDIAELWQLASQQRREDVETVTAILAANSARRRHRPDDRLVDVVYTLTSPETFELLVRQCGWSHDQYQHWIRDTLTTLIQQPPSSSRA